VEACEDKSDASECSTDAVPQGLCFSGVCNPLGCGNGVVDGLEDCDGDDLSGATCASLGYYDDTDTLACAADCRFDDSQCTGFCGDGIANGSEPCDGDDILFDCTAFGYYESPGLSCSSICTAVTDQCELVCGDGLVNGPELCDGNQPVDSCVDLGFDRGPTDCTSFCSVDFDECGHIGLVRIPQIHNLLLHAWQSPSGNIYSSGLGLFRFDGSTWTDLGAGSTQVFLGLWGSSDSDVYLITQTEGVWHYDGVALTVMAEQPPAAQQRAITGTGPDDVYLATALGVYHYDGASWTLNDPLVANALFALDAQNIYAAEGTGGAIWHYNGTDTWTQLDNPGYTGPLRSIWGTSNTRLFAAGGTAVLSYDGATWTQILDRPAGEIIINITGNDEVLLATGNTISEYDGAEWVQQDFASGGVNAPQASIVKADGSMVVVGGGAAAFSGASAHSSEWAWGTDAPVFSWTATASLAFGRNDLLFVGNQVTGTFPVFSVTGRALHVKDGTTVQVNFASGLNGLWSPDNGATAVAVGQQGSAHHFDGTDWTSNATPTGRVLNAVWGSSPDNIIAVGREGTIIRYTSSWALETEVPTTNDLKGVIGFGPSDIFAVGTGGTILHFDGAQWALVDAGTTEDLNDIWGTAANNLYVATQLGRILHYDGSVWTAQALRPQPIVEIKGTGPNNIYAVGGVLGSGLIWHFDGTRWGEIDSRIDVGSPETIQSVAPLDKDVFFLGNVGFFARLFYR
jgi:hypothetical protein